MALEGLMGPEEDERHLRDMRKRERTEAKEGQLRGLLRQRGLGADKFGNPDLNVTRAADKTVLGGGPRPNGETVYIATAKMDPPTLLMKQNGLSQHVWYQSQQQPAAWLSYLNFNLQREIQFEATGNYYSKPYPSSITMAFEKSKPETTAYLRKIGVLKPEGTPPAPTPKPTPTPVPSPQRLVPVRTKGVAYLYLMTKPPTSKYVTFAKMNPMPKSAGDMSAQGYTELPIELTTDLASSEAKLNALAPQMQSTLTEDRAAKEYGTVPKEVVIEFVQASPTTLTTLKNRGFTDVKMVKTVTVGQKSGCFIATAAFSTPLAPEINVLRQFRDDRLLTDPLGRAFVKGYYTLSPPVAHAVSMSETLKRMVRGLIAPMVRGR